MAFEAAPSMGAGLLRAVTAKCTVAIDFGTWGSGIAFSLDGGETVRLHEGWPSQPAGNHSVKTPSALLYRGSELVREGANAAWGWGAIERLLQLPPLDRPAYTLLRNFKLNLQPPPAAYGDPASAGAPTLPARLNTTQAIADYLTPLRKFAMAKIREAAGTSAVVHEDALVWCLTVPAQWGESAKASMRLAAVRAGMIRTAESDRLVIIIEPEAAALSAKRDHAMALTAGDVIVVVDAGGGTTDVTAHVVEQRGGDGGETVLAEAMASTGGFCGSTFIDAKFEATYRELVGPDAFDPWKAAQPSEYYLVMNRFEAVKVAFTGREPDGSDGLDVTLGPTEDEEGASWAIPIPASLHRTMDSDHLGALSVEQGLNTSVVLRPCMMKELFDLVVKRVVDLTTAQVAQLQVVGTPASTVLGAGGFMHSPYLQAALREALAAAGLGGGALPLVVMPNPEAAVVKGAVLYGCRPDLINARRTKYSYGMRIAAPHDDGAPGEGKFWHETEFCYYTDRLFSPFVMKGQLVGCNEEVDHVFRPLYPGQTTAHIELYLSDDADAKYVTVLDEGVPEGGSAAAVPVTRRLGRLELALSTLPPVAGRHPDRRGASGSGVSAAPDMADDGDRLICVKFRFGQTELQVTAEDLATHKPVSTRIRFAHTTM